MGRKSYVGETTVTGGARGKAAGRSRRRQSLFSLLVTSTVLGGAAVHLPVHAYAQQQPAAQALSFDIPAQPLSAAIAAFVRRTGWEVGFTSQAVAGKRSAPVSGSMTAGRALQALLAGTDIKAEISGPSTAALVLSANRNTASGGAPAADGAVVLDTITVAGQGGNAASGAGYNGTPDWVYETAASISVVSGKAIQESGARNVRDAISAAPGVYSGEGQGSFPTVSPNIRGVGDSGRVVISIDGARQNAQDGGRYGGGMGGYGTAFVDSAFIRQVDIDKNPGASAGNAGSLGGGVNFRTLSADDIIQSGRIWGTEVSGGAGTNAHDYQTSVVAATRLGDYFSLTGGLSSAKLGDYESGTHGRVTGSNIYNMTGRKSWSSLLKLEGEYGDVKGSLSWMHQQNDFGYSPTGSTVGSKFDAANDSVSANFAWDPETPLINAKASFWVNNSRQNEVRDARIISGIVYSTETFQKRDLSSFGMTLENTSDFDSAAGPLSLNYGVEAFRDDASSSVMNEAIAADPRIASGWMQFNRPGQRDVASAFFNGKLEPADWIKISGGLRYDWYRLKGSSSYYSYKLETETVTIPCDPVSNHYTADTYWSDVFLPSNPSWSAQYQRYLTLIWPRRVNTCMAGTGVTNTTYNHLYPLTQMEINRTDGAWLPSATVEFKPFEWLHPYVSYSQSFRPPTINEAFFNGGVSPGDVIDTGGAANERLRAEQARTWEVGFNIVQDGIFTDEDTFRFKASAFHRTIEDYIVLGYTRVPGDGGNRLSFVNAAGDTRMYGLELEGNYDAGDYWLGAAATWLETRWPQKTEIFSNAAGSTDGEIFAFAGAVPPRFKASLDAGVRLYDRNISLGGRVNHVTPNLARYLDRNGNLTETSEAYTTLDLHASFNLGSHASLNLSVNNVTDRRYVPATGNYMAPGRTFMASVKARF